MEERTQLDRGRPPRSADTSPSARRRASVVFLLFLLMILSVLEAGCDLFWDTVPNGKKGAVAVMTRNVYVGDDVSRVIGADPSTIPIAVAQYYANVQATDFAERAEALADEIAAAEPDLIGLQEVALYRLQSPSDYIRGQVTPNASDVAQDFLAILMDELSKRKLKYRVVNETANADIELPATTDGVNFFDLRLTDRDVILARHGVQVKDSESQHYTVNVPLPLKDADGNAIPLLRGFGTVTATVRGIPLTFVNTHLETAAAPPVQVAQANELLQALSEVEGPLVLVGDFNSSAPGAATDDLDTATYFMLSAKYTDAWTSVNAGEAGYTCCEAADLMNATSTLAWRIDHVWHNGDVETVLAKRFGEEPSDRTLSGLWPSDHAGLGALVRIDRH